MLQIHGWNSIVCFIIGTCRAIFNNGETHCDNAHSCGGFDAPNSCLKYYVILLLIMIEQSSTVVKLNMLTFDAHTMSCCVC